MKTGEHDEMERLLNNCAQVLQKWLGKTHPRVADIWNDLADLKADIASPRHNREEAMKLFNAALTIRRGSLGRDHLLVATTLFHMGTLLSVLSGDRRCK